MSFEIVQIPQDEGGIRDWIERYKTIRLYGLKFDAQAFGSTYERESVWTKEEWFTRLNNPDAITFVTLQDGDTVGTLTAVYLPSGPEE